MLFHKSLLFLFIRWDQPRTGIKNLSFLTFLPIELNPTTPRFWAYFSVLLRQVQSLLSKLVHPYRKIADNILASSIVRKILWNMHSSDSVWAFTVVRISAATRRIRRIRTNPPEPHLQSSPFTFARRLLWSIMISVQQNWLNVCPSLEKLLFP